MKNFNRVSPQNHFRLKLSRPNFRLLLVSIRFFARDDVIGFFADRTGNAPAALFD
jgi:hypothetical protein